MGAMAGQRPIAITGAGFSAGEATRLARRPPASIRWKNDTPFFDQLLIKAGTDIYPILLTYCRLLPLGSNERRIEVSQACEPRSSPEWGMRRACSQVCL